MVEKKRNGYNILIVAFVALGSFAFGYSNTIVGLSLYRINLGKGEMIDLFPGELHGPC